MTFEDKLYLDLPKFENSIYYYARYMFEVFSNDYRYNIFQDAIQFVQKSELKLRGDFLRDQILKISQLKEFRNRKLIIVSENFNGTSLQNDPMYYNADGSISLNQKFEDSYIPFTGEYNESKYTFNPVVCLISLSYSFNNDTAWVKLKREAKCSGFKVYPDGRKCNGCSHCVDVEKNNITNNQHTQSYSNQFHLFCK